MTKAELIAELSDLDDDTIVCLCEPMSGDYYELNSIESFSDEKDYYDIEDNPKTGKIVVL